MGRHLRLIVSNETQLNQRSLNYEFFYNLVFKLKSMFISKSDKIYILKETLMNIYREYEISTGIIDEPYFIKTEKKIRRIIRENKVDYYYSLLKKFR
jgi:hypothetical protein